MSGPEEVMEHVAGDLTDSQQNALDLMAKIEDLEKKAEVMRAKLGQSFHLRVFFPDAFKHGACKVYPRGNANSPDDMQFIIETGDGVKHVWKLLEVPVELWAKWKERFRDQCRMTRKQVWRD